MPSADLVCGEIRTKRRMCETNARTPRLQPSLTSSWLWPLSRTRDCRNPRRHGRRDFRHLPWICPNVYMPKCLLGLYPCACMPKCLYDQMPICPDAYMPGCLLCPYVYMLKSVYAHMPICPNGYPIIPKCLYVQMPMCQHALMPWPIASFSNYCNTTLGTGMFSPVSPWHCNHVMKIRVSRNEHVATDTLFWK